MKSFLTFCFCLLCCNLIFSQVSFTSEPNNFSWQSNVSRNYYDTLFPTNVVAPGAGCNFIYYYTYQTGYVVGNNPKGDKQKLEKYGMFQSEPGVNYCDEVMVYFRKKKQSSNPGNVVAIVYDVNPITHGPGNELYVSDPLNLANIDTTIGNLTTFIFPFAIQVPNDSLFVGFEMQLNNGDFLGAASTKDGCYSGKQMAWEQRSDNSYHAFNENSSSDWGLNIDLWIFPVVELPGTGTGKSITSGSLQLFDPFPQPADQLINFNYSVASATPVTIKIYDNLGKLLETKNENMVTPGKHLFQLDVSKFTSGMYHFEIDSNDGTLITKFVVQGN